MLFRSQKESKTNNAEKELDDLPKSKKPRLVEQPDAANHTLPEDLDDAAKSAEEKAEQDVRDQAEDEQRDHDQEQQTAKPGKKTPKAKAANGKRKRATTPQKTKRTTTKAAAKQTEPCEPDNSETVSAVAGDEIKNDDEMIGTPKKKDKPKGKVRTPVRTPKTSPKKARKKKHQEWLSVQTGHSTNRYRYRYRHFPFQ